jgi:hypothetical protein
MFQTDEIVDLLEHFPLLSRLSRLEVETIAREGDERWASDGDRVLS